MNPTGRFVVGGPLADSGLTGRKVIADTYGGVAHHGGGAFSGKDGTKVDRSAAYAARQAALHLVRNKMARRAEVAIAYAIGVERPVAVSVDTFGTGTAPDSDLAELVASLDAIAPEGLGFTSAGAWQGSRGSLQQQVKPLDMVVPDQFIDRTHQRPISFFGQGAVAHVALADPFCAGLSRLLADVADSLMPAGRSLHRLLSQLP